jgi:hypothetical protein
MLYDIADYCSAVQNSPDGSGKPGLRVSHAYDEGVLAGRYTEEDLQRTEGTEAGFLPGQPCYQKKRLKFTPVTYF